MRVKKSSDRPAVHCTLCGREIVWGEEYWCCNGTLVCRACLPELALRELLPLWQEARDLARITAHYYDKEAHR